MRKIESYSPLQIWKYNKICGFYIPEFHLNFMLYGLDIMLTNTVNLSWKLDIFFLSPHYEYFVHFKARP